MTALKCFYSFSKRLLWVSPALVMAMVIVTSMVAQAQLTTDCPYHVYLGNNPSGDNPDWSEQAQGLANDGEYWFFTHKEGMMKYSKNWYAVDGGDPGKIASTGLDDLPAELSQLVTVGGLPIRLGINHFGDPDYYGGYIFVPLEGNDVHKAVIAAYRASDLELIDWVDVTVWQTKVGWLAVQPQEQALYTSGSSLSASNPLLRYSFNLSLIDNAIQGDFLVPISTPPLQVLEMDGSVISGNFSYMQGGVFTPWGDLYLSVGAASAGDDTRGGLYLFRRDASGQSFKMIQKSVNVENQVGQDVFAYEYHTGFPHYQEPEGIDWWNQDNDPNARYEGQLHAILLSNDVTDDVIWLKHYEVDYFCMAGEDSDGDGISDTDEVCEYNTNPLIPDNLPPNSNPGGPYSAECNGKTTAIALDGTASNDPDEGDLSYSWTSSCLGASFDNSSSATPTLTVNTTTSCFSVCGARLVVTDEWGLSDTADATVTITDKTNPAISCPADNEIECSASSDPISMGYATSSDICDFDPNVSWSDSEIPGNCGQAKTIERTWTATDRCGNSSSCTQTINVVDTTAPVITPAPDITIECDTATGPSNTGYSTATDNCDSAPTVTYNDVEVPGSCPAENTIIRTWIATDNCGNSSSYDQRIEVVDTTPPVISSVSASPDILWSPNHKMEPITVSAIAMDNCDPEPACKVISVESNEPINGTGDGDTAPDWEIAGDLTVNLRAERAGSGSGREYTITVECTDDCNNSATADTTITVPHDE